MVRFDTKLQLPGGARIKTVVYDGEVNAHEKDDRKWKAMDVCLAMPNGKNCLLCSVDYEDSTGIRLFVYGDKNEETVFEYPNRFMQDQEMEEIK